MNKVVVCWLLMMVTGVPALAQRLQLNNFDELLSALKKGNEVRAVIYYAHCKLIADSVETKSPDAIGGLSLSTFEYFAAMSVKNPKAFVSASQTVLISHPRYGHVLNYVKLKIYQDNTVEITARYLSPTTYQIVMDETFYGDISSGNDDKAVCLFERVDND
jgi:hypothetical protein